MNKKQLILCFVHFMGLPYLCPSANANSRVVRVRPVAPNRLQLSMQQLDVPNVPRANMARAHQSRKKVVGSSAQSVLNDNFFPQSSVGEQQSFVLEQSLPERPPVVNVQPQRSMLSSFLDSASSFKNKAATYTSNFVYGVPHSVPRVKADYLENISHIQSVMNDSDPSDSQIEFFKQTDQSNLDQAAISNHLKLQNQIAAFKKRVPYIQQAQRYVVSTKRRPAKVSQVSDERDVVNTHSPSDPVTEETDNLLKNYKESLESQINNEKNPDITKQDAKIALDELKQKFPQIFKPKTPPKPDGIKPSPPKINEKDNEIIQQSDGEKAQSDEKQLQDDIAAEEIKPDKVLERIPEVNNLNRNYRKVSRVFNKKALNNVVPSVQDLKNKKIPKIKEADTVQKKLDTFKNDINKKSNNSIASEDGLYMLKDLYDAVKSDTSLTDVDREKFFTLCSTIADKTKQPEGFSKTTPAELAALSVDDVKSMIRYYYVQDIGAASSGYPSAATSRLSSLYNKIVKVKNSVNYAEIDNNVLGLIKASPETENATTIISMVSKFQDKLSVLQVTKRFLMTLLKKYAKSSVLILGALGFIIGNLFNDAF